VIGRSGLAASVAATLLVLSLGSLGASASSLASPPSCQPGSGAKLAGQHLDAAALDKIDSLKCADLTGADLTGLDLIQDDLTGVLAPDASFRNAQLGQADLTGAQLQGADLSGADLTQATLTGADLSNADLSHAKLIQAEAGSARFAGADVSDVDFTQATLTDASFDRARVGGADFTQAELGGTSFDGVKGLKPWSTYLLIGAGAVFVLLAALSMARVLRRRGEQSGTAPSERGVGAAPLWPEGSSEPATSTPATSGSTWSSAWTRSAWQRSRSPAAPGSGGTATSGNFGISPTGEIAPFNPINAPSKRSVGRGIALGLVGSLLVAFGLHLFVGGLIGEFSFAYDTLAKKVCSSAQCAVGVSSGMLGLFGGVFVVMGGFFVRSRA
jgi:uncharacterized protein YjbI with pentapeptide repeats